MSSKNKKSGKVLAMIGIFLGVFVFLTAAAAVLGPKVSHAQTQITISDQIPVSGAQATSTGPAGFVYNFYLFALYIGGLLAFCVIVYGGVKYMTSAGNPSGQSDAKEWIESALLGLILLAGAYFILKVVNPQLVNLGLPSLQQVVIPPYTYNPSNSPSGSGGNGTCTPPTSGPCTTANLANTCMGSNAASAAQICAAESSNNPNAKGDLSTSGQPVSLGLFQINLSANTITNSSGQVLNCPAAFDHTWHAPGVCGKAAGSGCGPSTIKSDPTSQALYAACAAAATNVATNVAKACQLSKNGTTWTQWSTSKTCGL